MGCTVSLSDDLRKIKTVARMRIESIVQSVGKSLVEDIDGEFKFDLKLTDSRIDGEEISAILAGKKDFDEVEKSDETKEGISKYIKSLSDESIIAMVKKHGDL
jgi:hypothetical protein